MAKKKNSRKVLAVALGIMGIAGLSLASASQLNITATPANLATGTQVFAGACDSDVTVTYTTGGTATAPTYTGFKVTGIADACMAAPASKLSWSLGYSTYAGGTYTAATALAAADQTIVAGTPDNNSLTVVFGTALTGTSRLDNIAITIK